MCGAGDELREIPVYGGGEDEQEEEPAAVVEEEVKAEGRDEDFHRCDPSAGAQPGVDGQEEDEESPEESAGEHQGMRGVGREQREQVVREGGEVREGVHRDVVV